MELLINCDHFKKENLVSTETKEIFNGEYTLVIETYTRGGRLWNFTWGRITDKEGNLIASVQRNYSQFLFVELPNYRVIMSEKYDFGKVFDLKKKIILDSPNKDFCWTDGMGSGNLLAIKGCYWGHGMDLVFYEIKEDEIMRIHYDEDLIILDKDSDPDDEPFIANGIELTYPFIVDGRYTEMEFVEEGIFEWKLYDIYSLDDNMFISELGDMNDYKKWMEEMNAKKREYRCKTTVRLDLNEISRR